MGLGLRVLGFAFKFRLRVLGLGGFGVLGSGFGGCVLGFGYWV